MFKKKTSTEKRIYKLELQLIKYKQKRNFYLPEEKKRFLSNDIKIETISDYDEEKIIEYDEKDHSSQRTY